MAGVDQILHAIVQQGADELRLATDQAPLVFAGGTPRRFTMAPTPEPVLRQLLSQLLTAERLGAVERSERVEFEHDATRAGRFVVTLARGAAGLEATFITPANAAARRASPTTTSPPNEPAGPLQSGEGSRGTSPVEPVARTATQGESITVTGRFLALVEQAEAARASDLHLADAEPAYSRVDGRLERVPGAEPGLRPYLELAAAARTAVESGRALDVALELAGQRRLRVSVYRMQAGLAAAVRLLPRTAPELDELALPASLGDLADLPHGLVLVAGATGSGKSTTVAALCRRALERRSVVLVTLEEPIEFALPPAPRSVARQRQVGRDVADFNTGLRDALRSDPDVIMVGELRDAETIRLALTAAETGHLVLASLHGGSAAGSIERIVDAYPAEQRPQIRTQLADALRAIIVQRLLPRARGTGRVAALEVLRVTHAVANVIREGKTAQIGSALQGGSKDGQLSLERCLADYVRAGIISLENARAAANELDSLAMYLPK